MNDGFGYAKKYQIQSVPAILIFHGKQELGRIIGYPTGIIEEAICQIIKRTSLLKRENEPPENSAVHQDVGNGE